MCIRDRCAGARTVETFRLRDGIERPHSSGCTKGRGQRRISHCNVHCFSATGTGNRAEPRADGGSGRQAAQRARRDQRQGRSRTQPSGGSRSLAGGGRLKLLGAVIVLSAFAAVGMAFIHPFSNPRVEPAKAVSYTHLDVYKRQGLRQAQPRRSSEMDRCVRLFLVPANEAAL